MFNLNMLKNIKRFSYLGEGFIFFRPLALSHKEPLILFSSFLPSRIFSQT